MPSWKELSLVQAILPCTPTLPQNTSIDTKVITEALREERMVAFEPIEEQWQLASSPVQLNDRELLELA